MASVPKRDRKAPHVKGIPRSRRDPRAVDFRDFSSAEREVSGAEGEFSGAEEAEERRVGFGSAASSCSWRMK
jgi:hypothetical protein